MSDFTSTPFTKQFQKDCATLQARLRLYMPGDLVVARNCDADEAGDYRVFCHSEVVNNPNWEIMHDMAPEDLMD